MTSGPKGESTCYLAARLKPGPFKAGKTSVLAATHIETMTRHDDCDFKSEYRIRRETAGKRYRPPLPNSRILMVENMMNRSSPNDTFLM